MQKLKEAHALGAWRVRLCVNRAGQVRAEAFILEENLAEVRITLANTALSHEGGHLEFVQHKTTARHIYDGFSPQIEGVFDTLLYNSRNELTEFTRGNLVLEKNGLWLTPAFSCGLLPGVMRAKLLAEGRVSEAVLHVSDVYSADRLFFINSVRGILPAHLTSSFAKK